MRPRQSPPAEPPWPPSPPLAHRCILEALLALSEAAIFALLDEHPELDLRPPSFADSSSSDAQREARDLLQRLVDLQDAVARYRDLVETEDDIPF